MLSFFIVSLTSSGLVFSEESLDSEKEAVTKKLSLESAEVVDLDVLKITFGQDIDDSKEKDFIIKSLPIWNELDVNQILVDWNYVLLSINEEFKSNKQYEAVIISLFWTDGSTIVSGIDWAIEFTAPNMTQFKKVVAEIPKKEETSELKKEVIPELNSADESGDNEKDEEKKEENPVKEDSEITVKKVEEEKKADLAWKEVSQEELDKNIVVAAWKTTDLPTTWPEHIFFVILALILSWLVIHMKRKKI